MLLRRLNDCKQCILCDEHISFDSIEQALWHVEMDITHLHKFNYLFKCQSCKKYHGCGDVGNRKVEVYI